MGDVALSLLRRGYTALDHERRRHGGGDVYTARLLGRRAVVLRGPEGARAFYDESLVQRHGAIPPPMKGLLFGHGAVHGLDDEAHRRRRAMFLDALDPDAVAVLVADVGRRLERATTGWAGRDVDAFVELARVYGQAVVAWSGCEATPGETARLSTWMWWIVDGFGFAGLAYPRAWAARLRVDHWARQQVSATRDGRITPPTGSALAVVAASDLDLVTAAVELVNVLRPTVAVAWPAAFAVTDLLLDPAARDRLHADHVGPEHVAVAHEVRRLAPFVPALAGRARRAAQLDGVEVTPGDMLVLDVWGSLTVDGLWDSPETFCPARWHRRTPGAHDLIPQGGGPPSGHRCPGEDLTIAILAETARVLAGLDYELVSGRAADLSRIPTLPGGRVVVRCAGELT